MKRAVVGAVCLSALLLAAYGCGRRESGGGAGAQAGKAGTVELWRGRGVSDETARAMAAWIAENVAPVVDRGTLERGKARGPDGMAKRVEAAMHPGALCAVVVIGGGARRGVTNAVDARGCVGIVLAGACATAEVNSRERAEAYRQRVETASIAAVARACGLPACPFPLCALYTAHSEAEVDRKARNLCPPCKMRMDEIVFAAQPASGP